MATGGSTLRSAPDGGARTPVPCSGSNRTHPAQLPPGRCFRFPPSRHLHRIKWADVDGDKKLELIVAPLHGKGAKGPDWDGPSARLLVFKPPAKPQTEPWPMEVAGEANHIQHNFLAMNLDKDPQDELVTASKEGLTSWKRGKDGTWSHAVIGEGAPGEVKLGRVGGRRMLATVEPWHGAGVAIYAEKPGAPMWAKTTIESALSEGHALGWADFDGDGSEELAVGWRARGEASRGLAVYFVDREGALKTKQPIDTTGMDTEDLIVGDFNGDKKPDIVASGRATRNVKIYWNETKKGTGTLTPSDPTAISPRRPKTRSSKCFGRRAFDVRVKPQAYSRRLT